MRVSIINCVSAALDMLKFSTDAIFNNAGTDNFDYIVVIWLPSDEVMKYIESNENINIVLHETIKEVGYVPNLRAMINDGFDYGYILNDYCGLVNTDMYFGKDWLKNLVKYASDETIVNSVHISPIIGSNVISADLGIPTYSTFKMEKFNELYKSLYSDVLVTEEYCGGWRATNTMPYLIHKKWWEKCGKWELKINGGKESPDRRFFKRCHEAGARFTKSKSSIVYHHEKVERSGKRPEGARMMVNE